MKKTLDEIAKFVEGELVGDASLVIKGISGIKEAKEGDLTFLANPKYTPLLKETNASAVITPRDIESDGKSLIRTDDPSMAFAKVVSLFFEGEAKQSQGVHKAAIIADDAKIATKVTIGPCAVIESQAEIGEGSVVQAGSYIGRGTKLGKGCHIYPNVTVRERCVLGDRVTIHSGTTIGSDGFGFANVQGVQEKIPQIGIVEIGDDVEIGACVCVDRARFDKTSIGKGTKIDNLVQIAHNVIIGENCVIVSQVGISGSVTLEDRVTLAGQAGLAGHLKIGAGSIVASQCGVSKDVPPNTVVSGYPAKPHALAKRINASVQRLPEYVKIIRDLKARVEELESKLNQK